jgi:very-short-patch-repair endonuclease
MFQRRSSETVSRARALRGSATQYERRLWRDLRMLNRNGYHFRRQAPFRGYILDFVEHGHKLVVELDGNQHALEDEHARDEMRDAEIETQGYMVLRFWNRELDEDKSAVVAKIVYELQRRAPTRKSEAFSTSPQGGGAE